MKKGRLHEKALNAVRKFHKDEAGDIPVGPIILIGVIGIPLVIALVAFKDQILSWLKSQMGKVTDAGEETGGY